MDHAWFKKKLILTTKELIAAGRVTELSLKLIAKEADVSMKVVKTLDTTLEDLTYEVTVLGLNEHAKKSSQIIKLRGVDALQTLLRHDLKMIYALEENRRHMAGIEKHRKTFDYGINHIENEMPKFYYEILRYNLNLLPDREIDAMHYSHFIVHSLFFFQKRHLENLTGDHSEKRLIVRQLVASLFKGNDVQITVADIIKW
jgi:hypothetical protein